MFIKRYKICTKPMENKNTLQRIQNVVISVPDGYSWFLLNTFQFHSNPSINKPLGNGPLRGLILVYKLFLSGCLQRIKIIL